MLNKFNTKKYCYFFLILFSIFALAACDGGGSRNQIKVLSYPVDIVQGQTTKQELVPMANVLSQKANLGVASNMDPSSWTYNITFRGYINLDIQYEANDGLTYRYVVGRGGQHNSVTIYFDKDNTVSNVSANAMVEMY